MPSVVATPVRLLRRAPRVLALALVVVLLTAGASAWAWTSTFANPGSSVSAASIGTPGSVTATKDAACTSVDVTWTAAANANRYRVERSADGGATWTTRTTAATGTSWTDAEAPTGGSSYAWRVRGARDVGQWTGGASAASAAVTCVVGYALTATNPTDRVDLAWSAQAGAHGYDIQRRVGGGAWVYLQTDRAGTTYSDTERQNVGDAVDYRVRWVDASGNRDTGWSNVATIASWQGTQVGSGGVSVSRTMGNDWTGGYQASVTVRNTTSSSVTWEIVLSMATYPFNGTITQVNGGQVTGTSGTDVTIKGASYNKTLAAGASVTFTYQADRGSAPPPVGVATATITVNSEWGTGYCADVTVSTTSPVPITWQVTKTRITDAPFLANPALWPASLTSSNLTTVSLTGVAWVFKGPSWANTIVAGQTQTIGYCANKS